MNDILCHNPIIKNNRTNRYILNRLAGSGYARKSRDGMFSIDWEKLKNVLSINGIGKKSNEILAQWQSEAETIEKVIEVVETEMCEDCKFFDAGSDEYTGRCLRYAPRPNTGAIGHEAFWPTVKSNDWCGDFVWMKRNDFVWMT